MKMTTAEDEKQRVEFAERAAKCFRQQPKIWTYTDGAVAPGELFAVRWGLGKDCVVVFRISEDDDVVNYQNLIRNPDPFDV